MTDKETIYFPGLNGMRAIAAFAVVISHTTLRLKEFNLDPSFLLTVKDGKPQGLQLAAYGVSIFFVLSGFLITYLLQAEKAIQRVNVRKFYLRRILRIWPLYYGYLFIATIIILVNGMEMNWQSFIEYLFYAANVPLILGATLPFLQHYWSLGVEEQFYLFWPWLNKISSKYLLPLIILLIALLVGLKLYLHFMQPGSLLESIIQITRFHCMMIGGAGAILYRIKHKAFLKIADNKITQALAWAALFLIAINRFHIGSVIDNEIVSVIALLIIIGQINSTNRLIKLENRILNFLGKISYGIYVIHPLLIFATSKLLANAFKPSLFKYIIVYVSVISATVLISYLSYRYFETYFLKIKKKFMVVKSTN